MQLMHSSLKVETDHKNRTDQFLIDINFGTLESEEL